MTERFWRVHPSSEGRPTRVLIRVFLPPGELDAAIERYERLQGVRHDALFDFPATGLALAMVGGFLLIEGSEEDLAPFRATTGTLLVDDIGPYHERLLAQGAQILFGPREVPTGAGFNARLPDGTVIEVVHHRPRPAGD